jgi:DNA-binding MarR family transcriptional regulator
MDETSTSPTARSRSKAALAADVWERMFSFLSTRQRHLQVAGELGLNPGVAKALMLLEPDDPRPMGALAETFACDASNVTWLVDQLEERGLAERRPHPSDRRVKTVVLTPVGEKTRAELRSRMYAPPDDLVAMSRDDLEALRAALAKLPRP